MTTLTDDRLTELLGELGASYDVPEHGPAEVVATLQELPPAVPLQRRRWVQLSAAASVVLAGAIAAALAFGGSDASSTQLASGEKDDSASLSGGGGVAGAGGSAPASGYADRVKTSQGADAAALPAPAQLTSGRMPLAPAAAPLAAPEAPVTAAVGAPVDDGDDGRVVKTGTIALVVRDKQVSPVVGAVQRAAKAQGGYIAASSSDEYGDTPSGEVTIRVPVDRFEKLVDSVRALAKVRTSSTSGKDVTAQYADIEAQLRTLKATRERFLVILSQTKTISEILTVQQRVDGVSGQIDRLEGSRKLLASQSDLSTLTVSVSEEDDPVVRVSAQRSGFSQSVHDAKDGFVSGVEGIVRHSGRALLWVLCLLALLLAARVSWRVARRRLV